MSRALETLIRTIAPIVLALVVGGLVILALGVDPLAFYGDVLVGLFQWAGPMGAWAVRGVLLALLLIPLAVLLRMLRLLAGPRRRVA